MRQGLVAEEVLEDCKVPITIICRELKKATAAHKPKNINELETITHEEWAKVHQECCQKLVSGCITSAAGHSKDACHEGVEFF